MLYQNRVNKAIHPLSTYFGIMYHTTMATLYILYEPPEAAHLPLLWHTVSGIPTTAFLHWHIHNSDTGRLSWYWKKACFQSLLLTSEWMMNQMTIPGLIECMYNFCLCWVSQQKVGTYIWGQSARWCSIVKHRKMAENLCSASKQLKYLFRNSLDSAFSNVVCVCWKFFGHFWRLVHTKK